MRESCRNYRSLWLEHAHEGDARGAAGRDHLDGCGDCLAWTKAAQAQLSAFASLRRLAAPAVLEERVAAVLDTRGGAEFAGDENAAELPPAIRTLGTLSRHRAPAVLDRLVAEELDNPSAARTRRFAGDLERKETPAALEARILRLLRGRARFRRVLVPLAAAAAAAVVVWWGLLGRSGGEPERSFRVVQLRSAEALDPLAGNLLGGLTGGMVGLDLAPAWGAGPEREEKR